MRPLRLKDFDTETILLISAVNDNTNLQIIKKVRDRRTMDDSGSSG